MAVLCGVYTFVFCRAGGGIRRCPWAPLPLTAPDAAAFAVNGFWEFCRILALDLAALAALHFLGAQPGYPKGLIPRVGRGAVRVRCRVCDASRGQAGGVYRSVRPNGAAHLGCVGAGSIVTGQCSGCGAVVLRHPGGAHGFCGGGVQLQPAVLPASGALLCGCYTGPPRLRLAAFLQRYTWQSSELDEYITQQAGERGSQDFLARPPSCYRKTVLSLESPTGAFIASLRFANANLSECNSSILLSQDRSVTQTPRRGVCCSANGNLSGRSPSILLSQDRSAACTPHWGVHC